jgi:hypothetical protein
MLPGEFAHVKQRQDGVVSERFFQGTGREIYRADDVRLQYQLVMLSRKFLRDQSRVRGLIKVCLAKANGEGLYRLGTGARHHGDHGGGIRASAEHSAERNVGYQAHAHGLSQAMLEFFQALLLLTG